MTKLDIIIPFKGENEQDLAVVLGSINSQNGIDLSEVAVHLVNDGGPDINIEKFDVFRNLNLFYHALEKNVGAGLARQYGIDHSDGKYFMFIDSDDLLLSAVSLFKFFEVLRMSGDHQVIVGQFLAEAVNLDGDVQYYRHETSQWGLLHGKWFNREYIRSIEHHFHPLIKFPGEDVYFAGIALELASDIYELKEDVALWTNNVSSTMRSNNKAAWHRADQHVLASQYYQETLKDKKTGWKKENIADNFESFYVRYMDYPPLSAEFDERFWTALRGFMKEFSYLTNESDLRERIHLAADTHSFDAVATEKYIEKAFSFFS